jgi:gliding motility-associated-like protein
MHQVMDDFGNQYIIVYSDNGNWAEPDSILRHSGCCNDTLRATNRERNKPFYRLIKLNAAGKMEWQLKDSFDLGVVRMQIINNELYLLARLSGNNPNGYHFNGTTYALSDSFMDSLPSPNFMIHISAKGIVLESNALFSTGNNPLHFDVVDNDFLFYSHGGLRFADGSGLYGYDSLMTKVFRVTKKGNLVWSIERPRYTRSGESKFTKTDEAIYFFTRDNIKIFTNCPIIYKLDFDGNVLDSLNFTSQKIAFNYFVNLDNDSHGNIYAIGYIVEPVIIEGVSINTEPFVKKPLLIKFDKDLNYVWHRVLCDSNLRESYTVNISPNDAIWCRIGITKEGSTTNEKNLDGFYQWVKYNTNGDLVEVLDQPQTTPKSTFDDYYSRYWMVYETIHDELYVIGDLLYDFDFNPQVQFGDVSLTAKNRRHIYFTAKRNRKLLKLSKDYIACRSDSLELVFDPVYKKFEWYLTDSSCTIPLYEGKKIRPNNLAAGKYPVLVRAYMNDSLYWCHKDTFEIIKKPVAAFKATDTIICAYAPFEFINESTSNTIHVTNGEKWVWTFGDGGTETYNTPPPWGGSGGGVEHVYTQPGTYTVSLFYSNGFCDSTLTKNQYIKVVDAPAPGFTIDNNRGCSSFTVNITDTITKNTTKKEYNFNDGRGWVDVPVNQAEFNVMYSDAGIYWITQRLYGFTGCITQQDSVQIFVTPGFSDEDTSHMVNATYHNVRAHSALSTQVNVWWQCMEDAAVSYEIYRNGEKVKELDANSCVYAELNYDDTIPPKTQGPLTYTVKALDSCGNSSLIGRVGQPPYLTGEVKGNNELSVIHFTPYQDWNVRENEINYSLETEDFLGQWVAINNQNSTADFLDNQFLDETNGGVQLEKCYRVRGRYGTSKSSISNVLCLPYSPVIFIPTAFSPNADGLNDIYRPVTFGIEYYEVKIYNRYGQKLAEFNETSKGWDASNAAMGAYVVTIHAKGTDNLWYNLKQTVTVVR